MYGSPSGFGAVRASLAAVLLLALVVLPAVPVAHADGAGTDRLLIAEMEAVTTGTGKLAGAVAKPDFGTAAAQVSAVSRNWPAIRAELERRGEAALIAEFESALESVKTAVEGRDVEAATAAAGDLKASLNRVNATLGSVDTDGGRVVRALVIPLLLAAAVAGTLPALARRAGVRL